VCALALRIRLRHFRAWRAVTETQLPEEPLALPYLQRDRAVPAQTLREGAPIPKIAVHPDFRGEPLSHRSTSATCSAPKRDLRPRPDFSDKAFSPSRSKPLTQFSTVRGASPISPATWRQLIP